MESGLKLIFKDKLAIFLRKSISQIRNTCKRNSDISLFKKVLSFKYDEFSYGNEEVEILDTCIIHSLYAYNTHFIFHESHDLAQLVIDNHIFNRVILASDRESIDPIDYIGRYLVNILHEYCKFVGAYTFSKRKFNLFFKQLLEGIENDYFNCELIFIVPNLNVKSDEPGILILDDGFTLERCSNNLKEQIINSFMYGAFHTGSINYDLIINTELILRKIVKIEKSINEKGNYITSYGSTNSDIQKEVKKGIEILKRVSICQGEFIYTSNVFYRGSSSVGELNSTNWSTDPNFDFFVPNMIHMHSSYLRGGYKYFKKIFNKTKTFHFERFQVPIGRYLSALNNEKKDMPNAVVDYIILLESLLLDAKSEINFQFALFGRLFFSKNKLDNQNIFDFFKKLYSLRSDLVHGNDGDTIRKTIKKLNDFDSRWFARLKNYSHEIITFLIEKNIGSKKDFLTVLNKKLHK